MQGTVHLLVGAAIGITVPNPIAMAGMAFFSHYILDLLPHIDPETFASAKKPYTWIQRISLAIDVMLVAALITVIYLVHDNGASALLGGVIAQLPDMLSPLEKYHAFYPLRRFHEMWHWDRFRAKYWDWYLLGIILPAAVGLIALSVVIKDLRT